MTDLEDAVEGFVSALIETDFIYPMNSTDGFRLINEIYNILQRYEK